MTGAITSESAFHPTRSFPTVAETLAPVATRLGFTRAGAAPLMVLRPDVSVQPGPPTNIVRALGPELVGIAGDLIAAAFSTPRDVIARCIDAGITETAGVETYIAWGDEGPMCTVSVTPTGDTAAITLMATPPEHQRKGMGRALLSQVIDDYRRRGMERFHLGATEAGRPLYTSLGFELVADLPVWILEQPVPAQDQRASSEAISTPAKGRSLPLDRAPRADAQPRPPKHPVHARGNLSATIEAASFSA